MPIHSKTAPTRVEGDDLTQRDLRELRTDRRGQLARYGAWSAFVGALGLVIVLPLVLLQIRAFDEGGAAYGAMVQSNKFADVVLTTIYLAVGSVIIAVVLGTILAWSSVRLPARLEWLKILPMVPLMMPGLAMITGWSFLLSPRTGYLNTLLRELPWWSGLESGPMDVYTVPWIVMITGFTLVSYVYIFVSSAINNIDPSLLEVARTSGSRAIRVVFTVLIPQLRPALVYSAALVLLLGVGQFIAPLLLGRQNGIDVLTTMMYRNMGSYPLNYPLAAAYGSPLIVVGVILLIMQSGLLKKRGRFESMNARGQSQSTEKSTWAAFTIILYVTIVAVLPILALALVALSPYFSGKIPHLDELTFDAFIAVGSKPEVYAAIQNSIVFSLVSLLIVLPVGYFIGITVYGISGAPRIIRVVVEYIASVPLVMPGILFGAGIVLAFSTGPIVLYGTAGALILAYVILMVPHVTRMQLSGLTTVGLTLFEASRVHGAGAFRTHARILLPLLRQTFAGASALVLSILTHEFAASVMVRSTNTEVMGTLLYVFWDTGSFPNVAVLALIMCFVTSIMVTIAVMVGGRKSLEGF